MSHVIRAAFAASSMFACSACVTTDTFGQNVMQSAPLESDAPTSQPSRHPPESDTSTSRPAQHTQVPDGEGHIIQAVAPDVLHTTRAENAPQPQLPGSPRMTLAAPHWWQTLRNPAPPDGTTSLLAWEEARIAVSAAAGSPTLLFEPSDSRLRIILNMPPNRGAESMSTTGTSDREAASFSPVSRRLASASFWPEDVIPDVPLPEVNKPEFGSPELESPEDAEENQPIPVIPIGDDIGGAPPIPPVIDPHPTPEPESLLLACLGIVVLVLVRIGVPLAKPYALRIASHNALR